MSTDTDYDVIIIGSGGAGLAAGLYTSRAGLRTLILEKEGMGGELMNIQLIENYPGFAEGIQGPDLGSAMLDQTMNAGAEVQIGEVTGIELAAKHKVLHFNDESRTCKGVIVATGSHSRKLEVPGEQELFGKGVFYCATCDGPPFAGKPIAVAGAGDSGVDEGMYLQRLGCPVTILTHSPQPKAAKVLLDRAYSNPNITFKVGIKIQRIVGDDKVTAIDIQDLATGAESSLPVEGVLVRVGLTPNTQFLNGIIALCPSGNIPVNEHMETSVPGIYAAGDVRQYSPMQLASSVGDGVTAAMALGRYIQTL